MKKIHLPRKKLLLSTIGISIITLASFAYISWIKSDQEFIFGTEIVKKGTVSNTITATGTLEATNTVVVGTQVSGVIEKLFVDFNSVVKKGQLIAELDKSTLQSSLETAEADLERAEANFEYQESQLNRNKVLFEKELLAKSEYDLLVFNYKTSKAEVKSAKANLNRAQRNLSYASIYSPIDGVVLNRAVEEGQTVTASMNTPELYTIVNDLSIMQVEANVDEADIGMIKTSQRVEFTVDAFPEETFNGEVSEVRLQPTESSNVITYTVIVLVTNPELKLKPGMTASITDYVEEANDVLVLTAKALRFSPDHDLLEAYFKTLPEDMQMPDGRPQHGMNDSENKDMPEPKEGMQHSDGERPVPPEMDESHKIVWVKEGGIIHPSRIEIGTDDGTNVEILSGLEEGAEVITTLAIGASGSSKDDDTDRDDQKSPFVQERPKKASGGGPPR